MKNLEKFHRALLGSIWEISSPETGGGQEGEGIYSLCSRPSFFCFLTFWPVLQDAQKGLAGRPPSIPRSATAVVAFAAGGVPGGSTIGGGGGRGPCPPIVDTSSAPETSATADAPEV